MIGAGNVASHLAPAIEAAGAGKIVQVYSRTMESAALLASSLGDTMATDRIDLLSNDADIYLISLVDDALRPFVSSVAGKIGKNALWLHTSGSIAADVLSPLSDAYGVFYPLQTFTRDVELDIREIPLFIEGSSPEVEDRIRVFASEIFDKVYHADSEMRRKMHIAAVYACNFTNFLWAYGADILKREGMSFDVLRPLIEETLRKACVVGPDKGQTGPARRGDKKIVDEHLNMLSGDMRDVYELLSDKIMKSFR